MTGLDLLMGTFLLLAGLAGLLFFLWPASSRQSPAPASLTCWRVLLPREATLSPAQAAAFFGSLAPLLIREGPFPTLEWSGGLGEVTLLLRAPAAWEETLRGQLAVWLPGARLDPSLAPAEAGEGRAVAALPLHLRKPDLFPFRLPTGKEPDPLLGLLGALAAGPEGGGLRLTWGPAPADWTSWARSALQAVESGETFPPRAHRLHRLALLLRDLTPPNGSPRKPVQARSGRLPEVTGVQEKLRQPGFGCRLVVWAAGETPEQAAERARLLSAQLECFHDPEGNGFAWGGQLRTGSALGPLEIGHGEEIVLSTPEMGALFHLPVEAGALVARESARQVPPPPILRDGQAGEDEITRVGEALTPGGPLLFGLAVPERRLHLYVVGKTGTGKSTLLANLLRQDLEAGRGVGLIDPHGDLAERVLTLVPPQRMDDVLYFNPADREYPVPFNLLACSRPEERPLVASGVIGVFKKLYGDSWGPRLEHFLRNAVLALLETPSPSLLLLPRLLSDRGYRQHVLRHVHDPLLKSFFHVEFEGYDPRWRAEAISPILNKVGQFLASPLVRNVVGGSGPGFNLRQLMDRGGIFLGNLATGKIGEDNAALLGGLLVAGFQLAAMSRADQPEEERRDFFLYVDEFQHFANDAFAAILSEARKYRLSLTLSHQYLDQLPAGVSEAVFGNAGSLCVFRLGQADTARLVRELSPQFDAGDLVQLPSHHFCARIPHGGQTLPPFSARTVLLPSGTTDPGPLLDRSRQQWARPRAEVELEIADLWEGRVD